jgi:hypothetical protein
MAIHSRIMAIRETGLLSGGSKLIGQGRRWRSGF